MSSLAPGGAATALEEELAVQDLTVTFGGVVAVDKVSLTAPPGCITGLIGPNGAGKTTIFNACSGLIRPRGGTVRLTGEEITSWGPARRARAGLGRTFQRMELVHAMTTRTNVKLGAECRKVGSSPLRQLGGGRSQRREIEDQCDAALDICGITAIADRRVGTLSTGQRRLVELARVLAGRFGILLLDEPSSGLDDDETKRFGEILRRVVEDQGPGILLVEHDMALVMAVCERIHVLDFGKKIFEGSPADIQASDLVRAAYLGSEEVGA